MSITDERWEVHPIGTRGDLAICWVGAGKGAGYVAKITRREGRDVMPRANLIAAAPDLLAALKEILSRHDVIAPNKLLGAAKAAVDKAEGRQ